MAIRSVVQVGDDVLRQKCFPVEEFDEKGTRRRACRAASGRASACCRRGRGRRVF